VEISLALCARSDVRKTIKPLLEELAENEPGLREVVLLAGKNMEYIRNKGAIVKMPKVVIYAQELSLEQRRKISH
jgi:hypothetical protein